MAVLTSEIKFYLSGGAGNSDNNASLGGAISTTELTTSVHNLFDLVSSSEVTNGTTEYRCFYVKNTNSTDSLETTIAWISTDNTGSYTDISIGLDPAGISGTATTVANESTAPSGVTFSSPTTEGSALAIGTLAAGQYQAIWLKRVVTPSTSGAVIGLYSTVAVKGFTLA